MLATTICHMSRELANPGFVLDLVRDGRLRISIGKVATLDDAVAAFNPTERIIGQTIIRVRP